MKLFSSHHNIAVVGLNNSGKTTFITSFINHILYHDPFKLKLGRGDVHIAFDEELRPPYTGLERFPFEKFRRVGDNGKIKPEKTKTAYQYRCSFYRNDWKKTKGYLNIIDIPGERINDIPMQEFSYPDWSMWLLEIIFQDPHYIDLAKAYIEIFKRDVLNEGEIIFAYRQLLLDLFKSYRPIITPSTFLLNHQSSNREDLYHGQRLFKGDISKSFSGLNEEEQFAPIPVDFQKINPELAKKFAKRYENYKENIAKPIANNLRKCNKLAVLVDVTSILGHNTGVYNGNRALWDKFFKAISPGKSLIKGIGDGVLTLGGNLWNSGITKIAIIAPKADLVHHDHRGSLKSLIKEMMESIVSKYVYKAQWLKHEYFACAAVKSTKSIPNGLMELKNKIQGIQEISGNTFVETSTLPTKWPEKWVSGDFKFPPFELSFPESVATPPDHLGMDGVLDFLLSYKD